MALQISRTDPTNGVPAPQAYARIDNAHLELAIDLTDITVSLYYDAATASMAPIYSFPTFQLTPAEINTPNPAFVAALGALVQAGSIQSPKDALKACLYVLLKARPEFVSAVSV